MVRQGKKKDQEQGQATGETLTLWPPKGKKPFLGFDDRSRGETTEVLRKEWEATKVRKPRAKRKKKEDAV